jgi:hypothetical protein
MTSKDVAAVKVLTNDVARETYSSFRERYFTIKMYYVELVCNGEVRTQPI